MLGIAASSIRRPSDHHRRTGCPPTPDEAANHLRSQAQRSPAPEQVRRSAESYRAFKKRKRQDQLTRGVAKALRWKHSLTMSSPPTRTIQVQQHHRRGVLLRDQVGGPHGVQRLGQQVLGRQRLGKQETEKALCKPQTARQN